jgi:hypothetical protein
MPADFVAGYARILNSRKQAFFGQHVAVTDPAGVDFDPHLPWTGLRNVALDDFKWGFGTCTAFMRVMSSPWKSLPIGVPW